MKIRPICNIMLCKCKICVTIRYVNGGVYELAMGRIDVINHNGRNLDIKWAVDFLQRQRKEINEN